METVTNLCNVIHRNSNKQKRECKLQSKPLSHRREASPAETLSIERIFLYSKPRHSASLHLLITGFALVLIPWAMCVSACRLNLSINSFSCRLGSPKFSFHLTPLVPTWCQDTQPVSRKNPQNPMSNPLTLKHLGLWDFQWGLCRDLRFIAGMLSTSPRAGYRQMDD